MTSKSKSKSKVKNKSNVKNKVNRKVLRYAQDDNLKQIKIKIKSKSGAEDQRPYFSMRL
jgi:hypothetical protein